METARAQVQGERPSKDFFISGGLGCRLICRNEGLNAAMRFLLQFLHGIMPVTRINFVYASRDRQHFIPFWDSDPVGFTRTRRVRGQDTRLHIVAPDRLDQPVIINDLSTVRDATRHDASVRELPFFSQEALVRLPLFERGAYVFLMNFWSSRRDSFRPSDPALLQALVTPLASDLREAFFEDRMPALAAPDHAAAREPLDLCRGLNEARACARRVAPTDSTVLLLGETGSGKGVVAEAIHALSSRASGPFVAVNCGAIAPGLLESELFGSEKGAYTGSTQRRYGYFEYASGGTLFLDEIGELPPAFQAHLLHALEKRVIQRVGSPRPIPVNVRIIAATNRDLREMVLAGTFRKDLYYRLSVYPVQVPPLRRRREDILPLARHFIRTRAAEMGLKVPATIAETEAARLVGHDWPGNVRELANVVERALINHERGKPLAFELEEAATPMPGMDGDWPTLRELETRYLRKVLEKTRGNMAEAARMLGVHYTTLHARVKKLGKDGSQAAHGKGPRPRPRSGPQCGPQSGPQCGKDGLRRQDALDQQ